jgi:hypothetical protein
MSKLNQADFEPIDDTDSGYTLEQYYVGGLWFHTLEGAQKYANWWMDTYREYKVVYTRDEIEATKTEYIKIED